VIARLIACPRYFAQDASPPAEFAWRFPTFPLNRWPTRAAGHLARKLPSAFAGVNCSLQNSAQNMEALGGVKDCAHAPVAHAVKWSLSCGKTPPTGEKSRLGAGGETWLAWGTLWHD
jgi:hypothetical protein